MVSSTSVSMLWKLVKNHLMASFSRVLYKVSIQVIENIILALNFRFHPVSIPLAFHFQFQLTTSNTAVMMKLCLFAVFAVSYIHSGCPLGFHKWYIASWCNMPKTLIGILIPMLYHSSLPSCLPFPYLSRVTYMISGWSVMMDSPLWLLTEAR